MPNWCRNELQVTDVAGDISLELLVMKLLDFVRETMPNYEARLIRHRKNYKEGTAITSKELDWWPREVFDFQNIVPYPEELFQQDADYMAMTKEEFAAKYPHDPLGDAGYKWRIEHWGTKWNTDQSVYVPQQKTFYFNTAWSPALPVISELHKKFPEAWFNYEYYERGTGVAGGCEFIPEKYWDPADYNSSDVPKIERALKLVGAASVSRWEAGRPYNPWVADYAGFKGG